MYVYVVCFSVLHMLMLMLMLVLLNITQSHTQKVNLGQSAQNAQWTWEKGSPGCSLLCLVTLLLPFINSKFINLFNKNDLHETHAHAQ